MKLILICINFNKFQVYSPYILEDLDSNVDYEVYIDAINVHGVGEPSTRLIFKTQSRVNIYFLLYTFKYIVHCNQYIFLKQVVEEEIITSLTYNVTACCESVSLSDICMPLCSYDASMVDLKLLAGLCSGEFHKLIKCGAGGTFIYFMFDCSYI